MHLLAANQPFKNILKRRTLKAQGLSSLSHMWNIHVVSVCETVTNVAWESAFTPVWLLYRHIFMVYYKASPCSLDSLVIKVGPNSSAPFIRQYQARWRAKNLLEFVERSITTIISFIKAA